MRTLSALGLLVALAVGGPGVAAAAPVTVEYPSTECPDTGDEGLQQCIDGVDPGSTVILNTEIIEEGASITKSLTLRGIDRDLMPVLTGIGIGSPATGSARITLEDVRLRFGALVRLISGSGHVVAIRRVDVGRPPITLNPRGINVQADVPASITIENSIIRSDQEDQVAALPLFTQNAKGQVNFRVVGNRITAAGDTQSGSGIGLQMEGVGSVRADFLNNVIWDVATCRCGAAAGISIVPDLATRVDVNIVGNTIDNSRTNAIQQRNDLTTGRLSLDIFNNIFTRNRSSALDLDLGNPGTLVFRGGFNDSFGNGAPDDLDGQPAGPGNLKLDPGYVDRAAKNFRLRPNSPLINKGITCSPGGVANPDAARRHRVAGPEVDIGAYETNASPITGVVLLGAGAADTLTGTGGRDIICGYLNADVLRGGGGADYVDGGGGNDRVFGGSGVDRVFGGLGNDTLCTRDATNGDVADGGAGSDKADTDPGDIRISIETSGRC